MTTAPSPASRSTPGTGSAASASRAPATFDDVSPHRRHGDRPGEPRRQAEVDAAVAAARAAFPAWSRTPPAERAAILHRVADGVEARIEDLAQVETRDNGSLLRSHRRGVMPRVAINFRFFADYLLDAVATPTSTPAATATTSAGTRPASPRSSRPWNAPLMLATWRIGPALAAGNTVVVKPPEWAPLTASLFADIAPRGRPAGRRLQRGAGPRRRGRRAARRAPRRPPHLLHRARSRPRSDRRGRRAAT